MVGRYPGEVLEDGGDVVILEFPCALEFMQKFSRGTIKNAAAGGESGCDECMDYSGRVMDEVGPFKSEVVVRISNVALTCY